jgi:hypothetical protein
MESVEITIGKVMKLRLGVLKQLFPIQGTDFNI